MSDRTSAQEQRRAQNRKAQQAYRKREASRAAQAEAQPKEGPRSTLHRPRNGQPNVPPRQTFEFVFQNSPGESSTDNERLANCMQQLQPSEAFDFLPLGSEDLIAPPVVANGFQGTATSAGIRQQQQPPPLPQQQLQQRPDSFGQTILHLAAVKNFAPVCQSLIRYGAALEAREESGRTPLHMAALSGFSEVVAILIAGGAFIDAEDAMGMTPLCLAVNNGHEAVVEVLLSNGADPNQRANG